MEIVKTVKQFGEAIPAVSEKQTQDIFQEINIPRVLCLNLVLAMVFQMNTKAMWTTMAIKKMM